MRITIEIDSKNELEKLTALFQAFDIKKVKVIDTDTKDTVNRIKKGNKKIDPKGLFGIWATHPKLLENIRKDSWQRNQNME